MQLHQYQKKAIDFAIDKKAVFLALDMGLGKTIIALKVVEKLQIPAIVISPINPMYSTWPAEIEKWGLDLTYDILHNRWKDEVFEETEADVLLINYGGIKWLYNKLLKTKRKWKKRMLILDESSMIKDHSTQRFKMLKKMFPLWDAHYRMCLSATPAPNGYHQLWPQYYMLDKGETLFATYSRYRGQYFHYSGPPVYKTTLRKDAYPEIRDAIKPITYRLKAQDYLNMPEYIHNEIPLAMPKKLKKQYDELEKQFILEFEETEASAFNAAALSMKLRQFIQGAVYLDGGKGAYQKLHNVKLDALKEMMEASAGQPVLCPIQFKFELDLIRKAFKNVPCIAGATSATDAKKYIRQWNEGKIPLLLCHPASLSHGVNLQSGGHVVLWYGLTWSLEHYQQLNGRLYRQGQKNAVVINHFIMKDTIDDRVIKVLKDKEATQEKLLNALRR